MSLFAITRYIPSDDEETSVIDPEDDFEAEFEKTTAANQKKHGAKRKNEDKINPTAATSVNDDEEKDSKISSKKSRRKRKSLGSKMSRNDETAGENVNSSITMSENWRKTEASGFGGEAIDKKMSENLENIIDSDDNYNDDTNSSDEGEHVGGFTVLNQIKSKKKEKVYRVLPEWLAKPAMFNADIVEDTLPVTSLSCLHPSLVAKLHANNIDHLFPVQQKVIPEILEASKFGFYTNSCGFRPRDICVSAPTGSGKTLAFVLPIVQALMNRVVCEIRALAVLPTRDLAQQVYKVFTQYCSETKLKTVCLTGQKSLMEEQKLLFKYSMLGRQCAADIIVATPGRLVEHLNNSDIFNLKQLRYLVIDEADRMMESLSQDWLNRVEQACYDAGSTQGSTGRPKPGPLTAASLQQYHMPMQKLLFSATLSQNPEKLSELKLYRPKLLTAVPSNMDSSEKSADSHMDDKTFIGKYTTPKGLKEFYIQCPEQDKPLMMLFLMHQMKFSRVLCFTHSVEATDRLCMLLKAYGGLNVFQLSSNVSSTHYREMILRKFKAGKIDILVCTDTLARGMDLDNVNYVISYDMPTHVNTYIHRIGRTARAGRTGEAYTIIKTEELSRFRHIQKQAGKQIAEMTVEPEHVEPIEQGYHDALKQLHNILKVKR